MDIDMCTVENKANEDESTGIVVSEEVPRNMTLVYSKEWSASKHQGGMKIND